MPYNCLQDMASKVAVRNGLTHQILHTKYQQQCMKSQLSPDSRRSRQARHSMKPSLQVHSPGKLF